MSFLTPILEITQEDRQIALTIFRYLIEKAKIEYREGQWRDRVSGYAVAWWQIKVVLGEAIDEARQIATEYSSNILSGSMTKEEWAKKMLELLKRLILIVLLFLDGDEKIWLSDDERILLERFLREQEAYLLHRVERMKAGMLSGMGMISRMYISAVNAFFESAHRERMKNVAIKERRVLGIAEHCLDCINYAEMGWQPIGTLPPIGQQSACMVNCKCHFEYMLADGTIIA